MIQKLTTKDKDFIREALLKSGLKVTNQRKAVYSVLLAQRDHPTVDEVFKRAAEVYPGLSLATIYNCLETFVECGLVRQVNHEREPTRYCPNLAPHAHFHDKETGFVHDIELTPQVLESIRSILPAGFDPDFIEVSFHGRSNSPHSTTH